jgi:arylformamidase
MAVPHLIDITLPFTERLPVWPGDARVQIERTTDVATVSELRMSSHVGTHLDAPAHFFPQGRTVEQIPLETLIGPCWVADVSRAKVIASETLEQARIPAGVERLLLRTGNSGHALSSAFDKYYVALDASAGGWLLSRHIQLLGVDGPSADLFTAHDYPVHRLLLANKVVIVEYLNLRDVKPGRYRLICLPLRYEGGDGAPARAVLETV